MSPEEWAGLTLVFILGAMSPGPSLAVVLRNSLSGGRRQGIMTGIGHGIGFGIYAFSAAAGIAAALSIHESIGMILKYGGVMILVWLGLIFIQSARNGKECTEIASHKFIAFEPDIPTRRAIDKILRDRNVEVDHAMEFDNIETVKRAVEIDAGISIVPRSPVAQEVTKKTIAMVEIEDEQFYRPLAAVHKKSKVLSPAMKEFLALLKKS